MLRGICASPGIVIGKAFLFNQEELSIQCRKSTYEKEEIRFQAALETARKELSELRDRTFKEQGNDKAQIFEAHLLFLEDPELVDQTLSQIKNESVNAEWALDQVAKKFIATFESMKDPYMRERAIDIKDVTSRILRILLKKDENLTSSIQEPVVLITHDLTPSQTASLNKKHILGFLTDIGGKTSHSAIMARTLGIPAIVGLGQITNHIKQGDEVAFDAESGIVILNPSSEEKNELLVKRKNHESQKQEYQKLRGLPSKTQDHFHIELAANIGTPFDLDSFFDNDAEAVGLYRTEFLFMDRTTMPTEDEQYMAYSHVIKGLKGKNCIIRTLDIGGDKKLDYLPIPAEANPFLGYRAIRLCLQEPEIFRTQLKALLRSSQHGPLSVMFPMISSLEELIEAKNIWQECKQELNNKKISFSNEIKIGMMIEVPSAAIISDILINHVDFFSIGTNDLTQYTCAVDRMNEKIEHLYNSYNPGLLRLIHKTIMSARAQNKMVGICGSMAHQKDLVPLFVGMGVSELSMSPMYILPTRKIIRSLNKKECEKLIDEFLTMGTADEIKLLLSRF